MKQTQDIFRSKQKSLAIFVGILLSIFIAVSFTVIFLFFHFNWYSREFQEIEKYIQELKDSEDYEEFQEKKEFDFEKNIVIYNHNEEKIYFGKSFFESLSKPLQEDIFVGKDFFGYEDLDYSHSIKHSKGEKALYFFLGKEIYAAKRIDATSSESDLLYLKNITSYKKAEEDLFFILVSLFIISLFSCSVFSYFLAKKSIEPLRQSFEKMKDFQRNIAHEIKTPHAIIRSNLELFEKVRDDELIESSQEELVALDKMTEILLTLSMDPENIKLETPLVLQDILREVWDELKLLYPQKKIELSLGEHKKIYSDISLQKLFWKNIIENACKYSPENALIEVSFLGTILRITNPGETLSKEVQEKIFDPFFQADNSRNTSGYGIGLTLVQKIAALHGWDISFLSESGKNTFSVDLGKSLKN